jgi:glucose-1-phosphate adenylyltransferase
VDTTVLGLPPKKARELPFIASMGIYVFEKRVLHDLLDRFRDQTDFGREVIPASAKDYNVQAYLFKDYWEDIGTIEAFYDANLALTQQPDPPFSFYDEKAPIYTRSRYLPPTKLLDTKVIESIVGEGCILKECTVKRSVIGIRSRIEAGCVIDNALLMGADYYESPAERAKTLESGKVPLGVGANTTIQRAIVDKNTRIGRNVRIVNKDRVTESNREDSGFVIRNGIIVVIKNATIADGTVI